MPVLQQAFFIEKKVLRREGRKKKSHMDLSTPIGGQAAFSFKMTFDYTCL